MDSARATVPLLRFGWHVFLHLAPHAGHGEVCVRRTHAEAIIASETEIVTVALRRADLSGQGDPFANILDFIPKHGAAAAEHQWRDECRGSGAARAIGLVAQADRTG